jgi:hypothetical protein
VAAFAGTSYTPSVLLAIARVPDAPQARTQAAEITGLALADLNRRLAGTLPRVLFPGLPDDEAKRIEGSLERLGFGVLAFDVAAVPGDSERVVARKIELVPGALLATDAQGNQHRCPGADIATLQRGARVSTTSQTVKTSERQIDVGRAVLSGGLLLTKKVEKTTVKTTESTDFFLLIQRAGGEPDLMLYERRLDYRALGAEMQPSSRANLELIWTRLKGLAPAAVDDRVGRPGFVKGLPATSADPLDLALYLVALARRRDLGNRA